VAVAAKSHLQKGHVITSAGMIFQQPGQKCVISRRDIQTISPHNLVVPSKIVQRRTATGVLRCG
jgi:hypothetical protein